jgi:hypothetical protein
VTDPEELAVAPAGPLLLGRQRDEDVHALIVVPEGEGGRRGGSGEEADVQGIALVGVAEDHKGGQRVADAVHPARGNTLHSKRLHGSHLSVFPGHDVRAKFAQDGAVPRTGVVEGKGDESRLMAAPVQGEDSCCPGEDRNRCGEEVVALAGGEEALGLLQPVSQVMRNGLGCGEEQKDAPGCEGSLAAAAATGHRRRVQPVVEGEGQARSCL